MNTDAQQPQPPAVAPTQPQQTDALSAETLAEFDTFARENGGEAPPTAPPSTEPSAAAPATSAPPAAASPPPAAAAPAPPSQEGAPTAAGAAPAQPAQPSQPAQPAAAAPAQPAQLKGDETFLVRQAGDKKLELKRDEIAFLLDAYNAGNTRDRTAADTYRDVFQMDPEQAKKEWGPIVQFLRTNAEEGGRAPLVMQSVLDALFAGGKGAEEYLQRALQTYQDHLAQNPPPQRVAGDPELRRRVEATEQRLASEDLKRANDYVAHERAALIKEFSCLGDPQVWGTFAQSAIPVVQQNGNYTLTDHAKNNRRVLELWQRAYDEQQRPAQPAQPQQPAAAVPALVSSNGASPAATRTPAQPNEEKSFNDLDEAVSDYIKAFPEPIQ